MSLFLCFETFYGLKGNNEKLIDYEKLLTIEIQHLANNNFSTYFGLPITCRSEAHRSKLNNLFACLLIA